MEKRIVSGIMLTLLLIGILTLAFNIQPVKASGTIYIRADGSIDPPTAPISTFDNITYTFTDNINDSIVVERDNIVVDGAGHTLQGTGSGIGIELTGRNNVTIKNTRITTFYYGIKLYDSSNNSINGNNITAIGAYSMYIGSSSNNTIYHNNLANNTFGIYLGYSPYPNMLRNNTMVDNRFNFGVWGTEFSHFVNDVDESNTVNRKPVYYWVGREDAEVPSDAGCVILTNCTRITAKNLDLSSNKFSMLLAYTRDSTITKNNITHNHHGLTLYFSSNNTIYGNNLTNSEDSIDLLSSSNNTIYGNNITNNWWGGIYLGSSSNNSISGNNIANNEPYGIYLGSSSNNSIYHNNFIDNTQQVYIATSGYANIWDDGYPSGGNYWSDYTGIDGNYDGIGDAPHVIDVNNQDNYPLMGPFTDFPVSLEENTYHVTTICNSTISDFNFDLPSKVISFNATGYEGTVGFCRIMIPTILLEGPYEVLVDNLLIPYSVLPCSNSTHAFLYFTYVHSSHKIVIKGALILPEHSLTVYSAPTGVSFSVDSVFHTTPWSGTYDEGVSVSLVMPETHTVGDTKYYWTQWSDGITSRSRTVTMNTDVSLTAYFTGPYYQLTVTSSPITGIPFTINSASKTTPCIEWLPEGYYTLEMPQTYNGYNWSRWLEDGDTNRIKTIYLHGTTWTGVYVSAGPPVPVGGEWVPINKFELLAPWISIALLMTVAAASVIYVRHRKKQRN